MRNMATARSTFLVCAILFIAQGKLHAQGNMIEGPLPDSRTPVSVSRNVPKTKAKTRASKSGVRGITAPVLVGSDSDCDLTIDKGGPEKLAKGGSITLRLPMGEHLIEATSVDGQDRWLKVIEIDKPTSKVVLIELEKVRAARENQEATVAKASQAKEAQANRDAAEHDASERRKADLEQRSALLQQKRERENELVSEITKLQNQVADDEEGARADDQSAQEAEQECARIQGPCVTQMSIYSSRNMAENERSEARDLRSKIRELQLELQQLRSE